MPPETDPIVNATAEACLKNPRYMATILNMMGNVIENAAPASRDGEVVVWEQLQSLKSTIEGLLTEHSQLNTAEFLQIRELISSIQGMSASQVESLIRQILAEQYSPAQIEAIIVSQAGSLISALQDSLTDLTDRVVALEQTNTAQQAAIDDLNQNSVTQQNAIAALQAQDSNILGQVQSIAQAILSYGFLSTAGGVITDLENLGAAAIEVHCEAPGFINYIVRTPRKVKCIEGVLESRGGMGVTLGHARLPIDAAEVKDAGMVYGQKHMITIPRAESIRVSMD